MRRFLLLVTYCVVLSACVTPRPLLLVPAPWDQRLSDLQHAASWQLEGRVAVAVGAQGWQASLNWHQLEVVSDVHLAGPFGVGALTLKRTPDGLSLNGAPPSDAVLEQLQERLGFDLPLDELRYWLLGIPDPDAPSAVEKNAQNRASQVSQSGWTVDYDRYMPINGDLLPAHLVLNREGVRVRIVVDRWDGMR